MTLSAADCEEAADRLATAYREAEPTPPLRESFDLTLADGYRIQERVVPKRDEGPVAGYKVGFTNPAIREEFGVDDSVVGRIPADVIGESRTLDADSFIAPQLEPELVFEMGADVAADADEAALREAVAAVRPGIEVVDCRIADWDATAAEIVADDAIHAALVLGDPVDVGDVGPLSQVAVEAVADGEVVETGVGANAMGDPWTVLAWVARELADMDESLSAGDVVSTGSVTGLVAGETGVDVRAEFEAVGDVSVRFA